MNPTKIVYHCKPEVLPSHAAALARRGWQIISELDASHLLDADVLICDDLDHCRTARTLNTTMNIVFLTSSDEPRERVEEVGQALQAGADAFVPTTDSGEEVAGRIDRLIRFRATISSNGDSRKELRIGDIVLDSVRHLVTVRDEKVSLTPMEFALLEQMMTRPGRAFSVTDFAPIFGVKQLTLQTVAAHICHLRCKIEVDPGNPRYIETVRGLGYRLQDRA